MTLKGIDYLNESIDEHVILGMLTEALSLKWERLTLLQGNL